MIDDVLARLAVLEPYRLSRGGQGRRRGISTCCTASMLTTAFTAFSAAYVRSGYCSAWYDVKCVPSAGVRSTSRSIYCTEPSRGAATFQAVNPPAAADTATTPKIKNAFFIITNWFNKLIRGNFRHRLLIFYFVGQTN